MPVASDRAEFAPPAPPGQARALVLAVGAHLLLALALTWGLQWKRQSENVAAEAELWSQLPQQAAPAPVQPPPPPPAPEVQPAPRVPPAPPAPTEADIALERQKKQQEARRQQEELERRHQLAEQKRQEALRKAEERRKQELEEKARLQKEEARLAALRKDNLARMMAQAGTGGPSATGAAAQSSGPSSSWAGRVRARVKPNIVFTDDVPGNPEAQVEVRTAPDGTIIGQPRLVKSSGVRSWDEAVVKALIKTEVLPRDVDGRVHSPVTLVFRPRD